VKDFDSAIKLNPEYAPAYYYRALSKYGLKDYAGAIADFSHAIGLKPDYAEAYANRGGVKYAMGDVNGAKADMDMSHELNPNLPDYATAVAQLVGTGK
jgi:tetratricopeptide (TPR) repeat protein